MWPQKPKRKKNKDNNDNHCSDITENLHAGLMSSSSSRPLFAYIHCYLDAAWDDAPALWIDALRSSDEEEEWRTYDVRKGELPDLDGDEGRRLRGVVISGSEHGVDTAPREWFDPLCRILQRVVVRDGGDNPFSHVRVVGGCFGAQVVAHALGGRVERQQRYVLGVEHVQFVDPQAWKRVFPGDDIDNDGGLSLIQSHGDSVVHLPPAAQLLASSPTCTNEIFAILPQCVAVQGHPEFNIERHIRQLLWPELVDQMKVLSAEEAQQAQATLSRPTQGPRLLDLLRTFIHNNAH